MIMYDGNFASAVNINYTDANVSKQANKVHELNFTTPIKYLRENGIAIDYKKIFFVEGQYYTPVNIQKSDSERAVCSVQCRDLFSEHMYNAVSEEPLIFNNSPLYEVLSRLLAIGGLFSLAAADEYYPLISGDYSFQNASYIINDIKKIYGDFDIAVTGLSVTALADITRGAAFELIKGENCKVLDGSESVGEVLTQIIYQYKCEST